MLERILPLRMTSMRCLELLDLNISQVHSIITYIMVEVICIDIIKANDVDDEPSH